MEQTSYKGKNYFSLIEALCSFVPMIDGKS